MHEDYTVWEMSYKVPAESPAKSVNHLNLLMFPSLCCSSVILGNMGTLKKKKNNCRTESFILKGSASPSGDVPRL